MITSRGCRTHRLRSYSIIRQKRFIYLFHYDNRSMVMTLSLPNLCAVPGCLATLAPLGAAAGAGASASLFFF